MEEFKGTPGPWAGKDVGICRQDDAGLQLGFIMTFDEKRRDECSANAQLIAAAPELLDALQLLLKQAENRATTTYPEWHGAVNKARSAIAKALGK